MSRDVHHVVDASQEPEITVLVANGAALRDGKADIYAYDVASRAITNLTRDDESSDFGPAFSPDGKWIYYSSVHGTTAKIFRLHADAPDSREQVTYGPGNDEDPAVSPDGSAGRGT